MAGSIWRKTDDGWERIKTIWRKTDSGWEKIKSAWRKTQDAWERIFGAANPYPSPIDGPQLWFIESPYSSSSNKSFDSSQLSGAAFQNSKMYVQRGKWEEDPIYFEVRIQKKDSGGTWSVINPPGINTARFSYIGTSEYTDDDYEKVWPELSNDWPTVSLNDIKNKSLFRAKFRVSQTNDPTETELDQLEYHFPNDLGIAPRLAFALNPYADGDLVEDKESSIPALKVLSLKWRFNTSFFPITETSQVIGKQILEVTDFYGNVVLGPYDVSINNFNPQNQSINYTQAMIDSGEEYIINLYIVANDYYYQSGYSLSQHINDNNETTKIYSLIWSPEIIVEDPTVTITDRTLSSFNVEWYSSNAEKYRVNIYNASTNNSLFGYPIDTTDISAGPFGLSENTLYSVDVTGLAGSSDQYESNTITKSVRTLTQGIPASLSSAYDITSTSFKTRIQNLSELEGFDIQINLTSGSYSLSGDVITVSGISQGIESCVSVTTSMIDDVDLTAQSFDIAYSNNVCHTANTWYCKTTTSEGGCVITTETYDKSLVGSGFVIFCSTDQNYIGQCCSSNIDWDDWGVDSVGSWSDWSSCSNGIQTRTRPITETRYGTETFPDCTTASRSETRDNTETQQRVCCPVSYSWNDWEDVSVGLWSAWSSCSGGFITRSRQVQQERTGVRTNEDCSTTNVTDSQTITQTQSQTCCTFSEDCSEWVYIYGPAWSACVNGTQSRSYTRTRTCVRTNTDCSTGTIEDSEDGIDTRTCCPAGTSWNDWADVAIGLWSAWSTCSNGIQTRTRTIDQERTGTTTYEDCTTASAYETRTITETQQQSCSWYCTTSVSSNCAGCTNSIESSNISQSGSGYSIACSTTSYPSCQTPCSEWWCKTTNAETGYCSLSGPYTTDQTGNSGLFRTVCTTGTSNPYSCGSQPPFFPPHFPPFFPPHFPPFFPPFFPPHFPPFFPPHFPPFFPPFFPPHFPPFFPPHFPPFFPPFFPPHFPPFFPPFFFITVGY